MNKIRLADYVAQRCVEAGAKHTFLVTGGGSMHLNDAFARNPNLEVVCFHHEQSAAIAAESYFRASNRLAVLNVTTGPGGINALNGVYGAYTDSLGMLVISGQVKKETYLGCYDTPFRQLGDQEVNIVKMAKPVVKYATTIFNSSEIKKVMDKAIYLAVNGRPGPVWVDIPLDIQGELIDIDQLDAWNGDLEDLINDPAVTENTKAEIIKKSSQTKIDDEISEIVTRLKESKRPALFVGAGIRISGMHKEFLNLANLLGIPVVTGWNAHDTLTNDNPLYAGRPGTVGDRAGNFTVQNADFLLVLGSRLNIRQISYNFKNFAKNAYKVHVDIDPTELDKPTLNTDLCICADLRDFIPKLRNNLSGYSTPEDHKIYLEQCRQWVKKYPTVLPEYRHNEDNLNPYKFLDELIGSLDADSVIVAGNGSACVISFQVANLKEGQRLYTNSGSASMGYDLPAAIGASIALGKKVICLAGDGSLMMNLQELQTVIGYNLPIKVIVLNNNGYHSIKQTQENYFSDNVFGTNGSNGVTFPDFVKVGNALRIDSYKVSNIDQFRSNEIHNALMSNQSTLIEVMLDPNQGFAPKLAAKKLEDGTLLAPSLENMSPFLPDIEMAENMIAEKK